MELPIAIDRLDKMVQKLNSYEGDIQGCTEFRRDGKMHILIRDYRVQQNIVYETIKFNDGFEISKNTALLARLLELAELISKPKANV